MPVCAALQLPAWKTEALSKIGVGFENKVVLRFSEPFWPAVDIIGCVASTVDSCGYFLNLGKATVRVCTAMVLFVTACAGTRSCAHQYVSVRARVRTGAANTRVHASGARRRAAGAC